MSNIRFLWGDYSDKATLSFASGAAQSGWPLSWVQNDLRTKALKTDCGGEVEIDIDMGIERYLSGMSLVETDLKDDSEVTLEAYSDAARTDLIMAQTWEAVGPLMAWGAEAWGVFAWGGYATDEQREQFPRITSVFWFDLRTFSRYLKLRMSNGVDFHLGRLILGDYWEPVYNYTSGAKDGMEKHSRADESLGGIKFPDEMDPARTQEFSLDYMTQAERYGPFERLRRYGGDKSFIVQMDDTDELSARMTTMYCQFAKLPTATENGNTGLFKAGFSLEESM